MEGTALERLLVDLSDQVRGRFYGKYRGTVADVNDPQGLGRIRAEVPEVLHDKVSSWALPALPFSGAGMGAFTIPSAGAGVWIEFEAGDASRPIWTGCFWGRDQVPQDEAGATAGPPVKIWRSEKGLMVILDDGAERVAISDAAGNNLITLKAQAGEIRIQAAAKVIVEAPQIELVDGAPHPLVFGDDLLQYLSQVVSIYQGHTHPGEMAAGVLPVSPAPPVPPMPAPSPSLLSVKVKTG
ncbi:MAG TPA: phage baseplate assembly protein V [Fibrobacteria bacterium]|nr:phage baseplate assembly protein V [Fibrobacteria bacterium]